MFVSVGTILALFLPSNEPILVFESTIGNPAILSAVGAHLLLNMKKAGEKGLNEGVGSVTTKATVSGMDFTSNGAQVSTVHYMVCTGFEGGTIQETETVEV